MKALKGSAEEKSLVQRYTRQMEAQEDRLATLNRELDDLNDKKDKADDELDEIVEGISLDENL
jgi:predicted  nucleic acid-binding Zn-ribbon protein